MSVVKEMYQMTSINLTDALTEESSQEASVFDETELIGSPNTDMVAAQLASAGMPFSSFYHMMLCIAQTMLSVLRAVCWSVCRRPVFCGNSYTCHCPIVGQSQFTLDALKAPRIKQLWTVVIVVSGMQLRIA